MKNPYLELYSLMGEATKVDSPFFMAKIKSVSPFTVSLSDITLDKDDLLIDSSMYKLHTTSNIETKDKLNINDTVLLLRIKNENMNDKFIVISKVVAI